MSLILDALRKADSERERGSVPGLHAHPLPALPVEPAPRPRVKGWQWAVIGVAAGVAVAGYFIGRDTPTREVRTPPPQANPISKNVAAAPPTSGAPTAPTVPAIPARAAARDDTPAAAEPAPWPLRESRKPPPAPKAAAASGAAVPAPDSPATVAPTSGAAARPAPAGARTAAPAATETRGDQSASTNPAEPAIIARDQLPQHIKAALPPLAISGSIYSPNAPDRTLIVNGRLYRENQALSADLSLEQIRQKSAVLKFKGYRFEVLF